MLNYQRVYKIYKGVGSKIVQTPIRMPYACFRSSNLVAVKFLAAVHPRWTPMVRPILWVSWLPTGLPPMRPTFLGQRWLRSARSAPRAYEVNRVVVHGPEKSSPGFQVENCWDKCCCWLKEILGYNTTANLDNVAAGAVASYYGVAGCRTFNDLTDRGCMSGVTRQNWIKLSLSFVESACTRPYPQVWWGMLWVCLVSQSDIFGLVWHKKRLG